MSQTFPDVPSDHPHAKGIEWAAGRGLVKGKPDGTYAPEDPVTRGQLATILWRQAGSPVEEPEPPPPPPPPPGEYPTPDTNPSNFAQRLASTGPGDVLTLDAGTYRPNQLATSGQRIVGVDRNAVLFDGEQTRAFALVLSNDLALENLTFTGWWSQDKGQGPLDGSGNRVRIRNVRSHRNLHSGMRLAGRGWVVDGIVCEDNGQYGMSGGGVDNTVRNFVWRRNGLENGAVPRYAISDRGGCKFVLSSGLVLEDFLVEDHEDNGLWLDIANTDAIIRRGTIRNVEKHGVSNEISGGPVLVEDVVIRNSGTKSTSSRFRRAAMFSHTSPSVTVRNVDIDGCRNGIVFWELPDRIKTRPDGKQEGGRVETCLIEGSKVRNAVEYTAAMINCAGRTSNVWRNNDLPGEVDV